MKIVVIDTTIDGDLIGGAQTFLPKLLKGLSDQRHIVHLIAKGTPNKKVRRQIEEAAGAILHTQLWQANGFVEDTAPVLARWLNVLNPDIFLISVSPDIGWATLPLLNPQIAALTIGHTDLDTFYLPAKHYKNYLTAAIGVSKEICENYKSVCGINENKIKWIPYGVASKEDRPSENQKQCLNLIYVGRIDEGQKRVSDLIKIIRFLYKKNINFEFNIVGDGDEMPVIKESLREEINSGKVILHGWLTSEEVIGKLRNSDIFVLTSAYEGFCIALIEAMANGCCPVVSDIKSGNKQLIENEKNGFIVPIGDVEGFVDKIEFLAGNPSKLLEMRRKAWETGKDYSIDRMVDSYQECFTQAVKEARENPRQKNQNFPLMDSCRSKYPMWMRRIKAKAKSFIAS